MNKKVSIVIPIYNVEKYIKKCIESIINQTYKNIEIVLINDGSSDESLKILENYQKQDSRIILISRENKGSIYSRLEGMEKSTGEYIMFVDSDDWIDIDTIEKTVQVAEKYHADIVRFNMIREQVLENIRSPIKGPYRNEKYISKEKFNKYFYPIILNTYSCNPICGQLIRKQIVKHIKIKEEEKHIKMGDDLLINFEFYNNINSIVFIEKYFYHYRKTENSITTTKDIQKIKENIKDIYYVYNKLFEMAKIWNVNTNENNILISNRIIKELVTTLNSIFISNLNKSQKIEIIKDVRQLVRKDLKINLKEINKLGNLFWNKKYDYVYFYGFIRVKIPYLIKKQIKRIMAFLNKLGGNI